MSGRLILIIAVVAAVTAKASAQVHSVDLQGPRPFGYLIGDVIHIDVRIAVAEPFALLPSSLPTPRPINYWLDLKSVAVDDRGVRNGERQYRLALDYQTFYAPLDSRTLEIPGFSLIMAHGGDQAEAEVPAWTFVMSPLREVKPTQAEPASLVRRDVMPEAIPLATGNAIGFGVAALLFLAFLAYHWGWWPFAGRANRPFARAARALRLTLRSEVRTEGYLASLLSLHRAFDTAAGQRVLADDVVAFVERAPAFRPVEAEIGRFFQASQRAFFGDDPDGAMAAFSPEALIALGARLAAAERTAP